MNFSMYRGDTETLNFAFFDEAAAPLDISGATIKFTCRVDVGGAQQFQKTVGSGITITNGPGGLARVIIAPGDTTASAALRTGTLYYYDIEVTLASGARYTFPRTSAGVPTLGQITLFGDVTTT